MIILVYVSYKSLHLNALHCSGLCCLQFDTFQIIIKRKYCLPCHFIFYLTSVAQHGLHPRFFKLCCTEMLALIVMLVTCIQEVPGFEYGPRH
jgi:hypothetical protein